MMLYNNQKRQTFSLPFFVGFSLKDLLKLEKVGRKPKAL